MNWLGDLWQYPFHASVWGTAGQWFGSILTGGSLFLGFKIMRINQKDKRREQASLVVFTNYYTSSLGEDGDIMPLVTIRGSVHNYSSALVTDARIAIEMTRGTARQRLSFFDRWFRPQKKVIASKKLQVEDDITCTILPDTDIRYVLHLPDDSHIAAEEVDINLTFMDANSVAWKRPFMGVPVESKRPGRIRGALTTRLEWKDWDKEHPDKDTLPDGLDGEEDPKALSE
ncbi:MULTISPECIES: hypothetical protein [unclassified Rhodococcus (in: high G+C Gram-positive bacteria)]|uniref:hypothetical protein n=1 Tax=unclassified Rhodococcus (in: high G+C Gram-positive bacteria) TaxID=192944 RepID=UPI0024B72E4E|nr:MULTISPECIES: hypothetical protein [unclassified Rhodococcus (in: high G+C Gram-positive bacteria)]MDI9960678.1 hypothetical protein [Rhodococcus sp. IEGM 1237]MDI9966693.1 hypothetical protein [Rhodococcus sp. IEGM 1251]MDV8129128.1 hypothetical protein [Rhodococcus sp. IEGM 1304]